MRGSATMKLLLTCLVTAFCVVNIRVYANSRHFRYDYTYLPNAEGWLKLHRVPANWHEARLRCHLEGTVLASPLTNKFREVMKNFVQRNINNTSCGVFTGISAIFSRGDFFSVEGVPLSKIPQPWAPGEPDNFNDQESCIIQLRDGTLADTKCTDTFPYLCYKKKSGEAVSTSCGTVDPEYTLENRTGSCYKFHRVPRTWSRAYMACAAEGGYLAIINNDIEAQVLKEIFAKNPGSEMLGNFWKDVAFVGFHDWNEHGEWLTIHGQTLEEAGYNKFSGGEPNNSTTGEYCGAIYRSALFDDLWCENNYAFICEKSPDSLLREDNADS